VAPVTNATVGNSMNLNGRFSTDEKGRYKSLYRIPMCPGFTHVYDIAINVTIPYRTYIPQRKRSFGEYLFWGTSSYVCSAPPFTPNPGGGADRAVRLH